MSEDFFYTTLTRHKLRHSHHHNLYWITKKRKKIFHTQFPSIGSSKFYITNSNSSLFTAINCSVIILHYTKKKTKRNCIFLLYCKPFKVVNYVTLVSLPCSKFARAPYCYYRPYEIKRRPSYSLQYTSFCLLFLFYNPHTNET